MENPGQGRICTNRTYCGETMLCRTQGDNSPRRKHRQVALCTAHRCFAENPKHID
jgi:hypothetical protein